MKRFYYISDSLDDLAIAENELESSGVATQQIHIFSDDDEGMQQRQLHNVQEFMKRDVVRATLLGALVGAVAAASALALAYYSGIVASVGWAPFILLAAVLFGFCTWEGGLFGIHLPHHDLKHFDAAIREGRHVLFVDISTKDAQLLAAVESRHPHLIPAGQGASTPGWAILWQKKWHDFTHAMP